MKKKTGKIIGLSVACVLLVMTFTFPVSAYSTFNDNYMVGGVGQSGNYTRGYWCDSSLSKAWKNRVATAMTDWCNTGSRGCGVYTSIWFTETPKASSIIDCYSNQNLAIGILALTSYYNEAWNSGSQINPKSVNWIWTKVEINTYLVDLTALGINELRKIAIVGHEMGHAFGLAHTGDINTLMYENIAVDGKAMRPAADDCRGVNHLYGNYNP